MRVKFVLGLQDEEGQTYDDAIWLFFGDGSSTSRLAMSFPTLWDLRAFQNQIGDCISEIIENSYDELCETDQAEFENTGKVKR